MKFLYASGTRPLDGYTIKRGIGRGGFGEVYYATSDAGKEVALKLVRRNLDVELRGVVQCLNLKHPHLLSLYDIRTDGEDNTWVVMEYVGGEALDEVLARSPSGLPVSEVLAWIHGIGSGVAYLHDRGIVHRDLKPGNVFCDEGVVKLGDYGLTKFISASRRSGQTESVGTVHYMAPEVANGRYGKQIDIYALGVILYEMLTGRVPFEGESVGEVLMKHLTAQPDLTLIEEPFRTVVAQALDKDPERRLQSVHDLLAALPQPATPDVRVNPTATKETPGAAYTATATHYAPSRQAAGGAGPAAAPVVLAQVVDEDGVDPVTKALGKMWDELRNGWNQLVDAWDKSDMATPWRVVVLILAFLVVLQIIPIVATAVVLGGIAYAVYRIAWALGWGQAFVRGAKATPQAPQPPPQPAKAPAAKNPPAEPAPAAVPRAAEIPTARHVRRSHTPAPKSARDKFLELTGSMLLSALVIGVLSVATFVVFERSADDSRMMSQFAWLAIVGTVGTWAILVPSKLWEGSRGDVAMRRFVLLIVGLAMGGFAYGIDSAMMQGLAYTTPDVKEYLLFFGLLYPVLRWWEEADPRRKRRFQFGPVVGSAFVGWLISVFTGFPQPWGWAVAGMMAASLQLASPWYDRSDRVKRSFV